MPLLLLMSFCTLVFMGYFLDLCQKWRRVLCSKPAMLLMAPLTSPRRGSVGDPHGQSSPLMEAKIAKLKFEGNPEQLATAEQRAVDLRTDNDKVVTKLGEATC
ncbi:hypothetical protein GW17_00054649 [Ensete ventricosum]|nr:hypothetical protein GW17_00054649 [Ensete ventricosum]